MKNILESKTNKKLTILILTILVLIAVIISLIVIFTKKERVELSNINLLIEYQNTNIGDATKVNNILATLPYSKFKGQIELKTSQIPYELTINYNINKTEEEFEYNSLVLFSLITKLDKINYNLKNINFSVTRNEYEKICELSLPKIDEYINSKNDFEASKDYKMQINKDGTRVFINPQLAFEEFTKDYASGIEEIKRQFNLAKLTSSNYVDYKTYGWQVVTEDEVIRKQASMVSSFIDIYENSFTK